MIEGEEDIDKLLKLRHGKMQSSVEDLAASLRGNLTNHHRFMLQTVKESIKSQEQIIVKLDAQIDILLKENELVLDAELLATIPGVGKEAAAYILAEIGE